MAVMKKTRDKCCRGCGWAGTVCLVLVVTVAIMENSMESLQRTKNRPTKFDPWVGKIPWRRKWQPTRAFLPGKSHGLRSLQHGGLQSIGSQRVGHNWATSLSYDPTVLLQDGYLKEIKPLLASPCLLWHYSQRHGDHLSVHRQVSGQEGVAHVYSGLLFSHENEILPSAATGMDLGGFMLSEISQTEKDKYCLVLLTCRLWKSQTHRSRERMVRGWEKWGVGQRVQNFSYEVNKFRDLRYSLLPTAHSPVHLKIATSSALRGRAVGGRELRRTKYYA